MCQVYLIGISYLIILELGLARQILESNEWIPLTNEEVYAKTVPNIMTYYPYKATKMSMMNADNHFRHKNVVGLTTDAEQVDLSEVKNIEPNLVYPKMNVLFGYKHVFTPIEPETVISVNNLETICNECNKEDIASSKIVSTDTPVVLRNDIEKSQQGLSDVIGRKPKAILEDSRNNKRLNNDKFQRRFVQDGDNNNVAVYKVTEEDSEDSEEGVSDVEKNSGYYYTPPMLHLNEPAQNNLTNILLNILSRHNIKPEDELPNYTLSRRTKIQNRVNAFMFIPIPLKLLPQFSNLKQLSVDPLLAVLMSNYGYYFPGSYGTHNRYRNLYGHLASNNIHNNKPFGSYKIFSDTDSSN